MKIGIDISSLQGPHRLRGIGYVATNFLKNIPPDTETVFVLYADPKGEVSIDEVIANLDLQHITYEIRLLEGKHSSAKELPGKLKYFSKAIKKFHELFAYSLGDTRIKETKDLDAFLQLDQSSPLPKLRFGKHLYFIAYDVIPYVLEADYLWSFRTARRQGLSRKAALKCVVRRHLYIKKIRLNSKRATKIFAISKTTQHDFETYVKVPSKKIISITLGLSVLTHESSTHNGMVNRYQDTSWGYLPTPTSLNGEKFLLFIGGADHRRKLEDLVTAFNHLRAENVDVKLVLSGDSMKGPRNISTHSVQNALMDSAYRNDIYFVGFSDDTTRDWLYENALAFVFPSVYEGFGLPVLEAMSYGTPVICYENNAVKEVAASIPLYAKDALGIRQRVLEVMGASSADTAKWAKLGTKQSAKYRWADASKEIVSRITTN